MEGDLVVERKGTRDDRKGRLHGRGVGARFGGAAERRLDRGHGATGRGFRETLAIPRHTSRRVSYTARASCSTSLVTARTRARPYALPLVEELKQNGLQHLRDAVLLLEQKAAAEEVAGYKHFVLAVADKVANAHREGGTSVSDAEQAAIEEIFQGSRRRALVGPSPARSPAEGRTRRSRLQLDLPPSLLAVTRPFQGRYLRRSTRHPRLCRYGRRLGRRTERENG